MVGTSILGLWLMLALGAVLGTGRWLRRLWLRRVDLARSARAAAFLVAASALLGALGTSRGLIKAFGALRGESFDPSQRAATLAQGISGAMNCTALALLFWIPSAIALAVWTRERAT